MPTPHTTPTGPGLGVLRFRVPCGYRKNSLMLLASLLQPLLQPHLRQTSPPRRPKSTKAGRIGGAATATATATHYRAAGS